MLNRIFLLACLLGIFLPASAQNRLGFKLDLGASYIRNTLEVSNGSLQVLPSLSGQLGIFGELDLGGPSRIGAELLGTYIQGKDKLEFPTFDINMQQLGTVYVKYEKELAYLSVPLWYGVDFGKWTVNAGVQGSVLLGSWYWEESRYVEPDKVTEHRNTDVIQRGFRADFGPRAAVFYHFNDHLSFEGSYYYGLIDAWETLDSVDNNWWKAALGIRVSL